MGVEPLQPGQQPDDPGRFSDRGGTVLHNTHPLHKVLHPKARKGPPRPARRQGVAWPRKIVSQRHRRVVPDKDRTRAANLLGQRLGSPALQGKVLWRDRLSQFHRLLQILGPHQSRAFR